MGKSRIENKLEGRRNYDDWKGEAMAVLATNSHWDCFDGTETDTKKNFIAIQALKLTMNTSLYTYIDGCTMAKAAWEALAKAFADKGIGRRVELLKQLIGLRQSECDSMEDYVNKMTVMSKKVKVAGLELGDEVVASLVLAGLSDEFKPMVMAIEHSQTTLTTDFVQNRLLQEVTYDKSTEATVLVAKKNSVSRNNNNSNRRNRNRRATFATKWGIFPKIAQSDKINRTDYFCALHWWQREPTQRNGS